MMTARLSYATRAERCTHPVAKRLFQIMETKQTNLSFSADLSRQADLLTLADHVGPMICVLKTHVDTLEDFDADFPQRLQALAAKHQFLIFEDRKFADIGNTVKQQYAGGLYHIVQWADVVNAHVLPGPGVIEGLKAAVGDQPRGLLLLAQMSSAGNLCDQNYAEKTVELALTHDDFVMGFIAQQQLTDDPRFVHMTPGVKLEGKTDALGQQYLTPEDVIVKNACDLMVVGRGIYSERDPAAAAKVYQERGWLAYRDQLSS